jgi:hypothetical protein
MHVSLSLSAFGGGVFSSFFWQNGDFWSSFFSLLFCSTRASAINNIYIVCVCVCVCVCVFSKFLQKTFFHRNLNSFLVEKVPFGSIIIIISQIKNSNFLFLILLHDITTMGKMFYTSSKIYWKGHSYGWPHWHVLTNNGEISKNFLSTLHWTQNKNKFFLRSKLNPS